MRRNIAILVVFALLIGGYSESPHYLPIISKLSDSSLFPNDLMSDFVDGGYFNVSFFFVALTFVSKYLDLTTVIFVGYLITLTFFCLGVFYLAKSIFHNNYVSYLAVILLMLTKPGLAGGGTFWAEFIYRDVAIVLAIFSIMYFIKGRYLYSFLLLGLSFNIHVVFALPVLGFFIFDLIFKYRRLETTDKRRLLVSLFLFTLIVSPLLAFSSGSTSSLMPASFFSQADPQWLAIMQARVPHHISPHTWGNQIGAYMPLLMLSIVSGIYLLRRGDHLNNIGTHKTSLNLLIVFFMYIVIEVIFTEVIPWGPVIVLQLVRFSTFVTIFSIIYVSYLLYTLYTTALERGIIARIISYLFVSGLFVAVFGNDIRFAHYYTFLYSFCWCAALMVIYYANRYRGLLVTLTLIIFLIAWPLSSMVYKSIKVGQPILEGILTRVNIPYLAPTSYYKDVQLWANENTNVADIFLVPPYGRPGNESIYIQGGFRTYSERPIYSEWSWGGGIGFFNHELAYEWYERMNNLGIYTSGDLREKYKLLDETKIKELQQEYNISYAVFEKPKHLNLPIAYENKLFIVYNTVITTR